MGVPQNVGLSRKSHLEMDDNWGYPGYPYDSGNLHIAKHVNRRCSSTFVAEQAGLSPRLPPNTLVSPASQRTRGASACFT